MDRRHNLDRRIASYQAAQSAISSANKVLAQDDARRDRLRWLEGLVRAGHPIPGTPEDQAEVARAWAHLDQVQARPARRTGSMGADGIWRTG